ncbi:DUF4352 domain-containing protein [Candidatus Micrarchaeota archaeon]|nr:DUF4352 domain-containing protein [Candidatus Micrarchaeota archaeon]MBD3418343.1 DUF4352 domain-containing protein [Candidatus Micrarchaeota archaeon]
MGQMTRAAAIPLLFLLFLFSGCCSFSQPEGPQELAEIQPEEAEEVLGQQQAIPEEELPPQEKETHPEEPMECPDGFGELEDYGCNFAQPNTTAPSKGMELNVTFLKEKNCTFDFMNWTDFRGYFLVFHIEAENTGTQKEYFAPSHFTLFDSEGKKRTASEFDVLYCANKNDLILQSYLLPNQSSSGDVWFEASGRNTTGTIYVAYDRNGVEGEELIFPFRIG